MSAFTSLCPASLALPRGAAPPEQAAEGRLRGQGRAVGHGLRLQRVRRGGPQAVGTSWSARGGGGERGGWRRAEYMYMDPWIRCVPLGLGAGPSEHVVLTRVYSRQ